MTVEEFKAFLRKHFDIIFYDASDSLKMEAKMAIEAAAIRCDHRIFNTGGNSNVIYDEKKKEITAWNAAGRPEDITDYKYMRIEQRRLEILYNTTITPLQAAQSINQTITKWDDDISYYREYYRLVGKAKIQVATSYDEIIRERDFFVGKLDGLA